MEDKQFAELLEALKQRDEPVSVKHDIPDIITKIATALCTCIIIYVASQLQSLTTDVALLKHDISSFEKFTDEPRFTSRDNETADAKLLGQIKDLFDEFGDEIQENRNDIGNLKSELTRRATFMKDTEGSISDVKGRLRELENYRIFLERKVGSE